MTQKYIESLEEISEDDIEAIAAHILIASEGGHRVFIMGNGGSASTASHFVNGLQPLGVDAWCLCDNIATLTAIANDISYEEVFAHQLRGRVRRGDVLIAISGSGNSVNVVRAIYTANSAGMFTIGLLGFGGGEAGGMVQCAITLSSHDYSVVESAHLAIVHMVCDTIAQRQAGPAAVFLDRDGTMAHDVHYCSRPEDLHLFRGTPKAVKLLNERGFKVIVVTNQSGIARGYFTEETLDRIHLKMVYELEKDGAHVDCIYYCPHHPDEGCECRKPKPKLLLQATKDWNINLAKSYVIGDDEMDMELGRRLGIRTIRIGGVGGYPNLTRAVEHCL